MKFAAILGAAVLGCAGAASAAEVGVQSTWGHSNTVITNGRYMSETKGVSLYGEKSQSWALGVSGSTESTETVGAPTPGAEYVLIDDLNGAPTVEGEYDTFGDGKLRWEAGELLDRDALAEVTQSGETVTTDSKDAFAYQIGGGSSKRVEIGGTFSRTTDSYDYTGTRSSGFSGISAFTR